MGYSRPPLRRDEWFALNGQWDFQLDVDAELTAPQQVSWSRRVEVPFSPDGA